MSTLKARTFDRQALNGRIAVVTGAARGIGRATALAFADAGASVVGIDICASVDLRSGVVPATPEDLDRTGEQVQALGVKWKAITLDQRNRAALRDAAEAVENSFGPVDILFANAGIQQFHPLLEIEDSDWDITIDNNLIGTCNVLRAFVPAMVRRGYGRVIVTTSTQGQHGTYTGDAYSGSKWGIIGLMKSAAWEWGKHGVTVNALVPGLIDTALTRHEERYAQALEISGKSPTGHVGEDEEAARQGLSKNSPLGVAWIDPSAVAPVVVFLASDAASMVSGSTYEVTAGDNAKNAA